MVSSSHLLVSLSPPTQHQVREVFGSFRSHIRSLLQSLLTTCPAPQHTPTTTTTNNNSTTNNSPCINPTSSCATPAAAHLPFSQSASLRLSQSPDIPKHLAPKPTTASLPLSQTPRQTPLSVTSPGANGGSAISAAASSKPSAPHQHSSSPLPHTTTPHPPVSGSKPNPASKTPVANPLSHKSPATPATPAFKLPAAPLSSASHLPASHLPALHPPASHPPRTRAALVAKRRSSMQGGREISESTQNTEAPGEREREKERAGEVEERPREADLDVLLSDAERALSFSAGPAANTPSSSSRSPLSSTPWWEGLEEKAAAAAREAEAEEASAAAAGGKSGIHGSFLSSSSSTAAAAAAAAAAAGAVPGSASARAGCQVASILASHLRQSTGGFTAQQGSLLQLLLVRPVSSLRK
ncbi:unnamed protein product [Closterium sp. NIES-53]